jgi:3-phenylpropionate/trans-cinnamate dioxygenase ferredoxin reductase component
MSQQRVNRVLVVGAGLAGARSAVALREAGYAGDLVMFGAEGHQPYDRPPLSKAVLLGENDEVRLELDWSELGVELRTGCPATGLSPGVLTTEDGEEPFDRLVLATGAIPRTLRTPGAALTAAPDPAPGEGPRVHVLRTVEDARRLRAALTAKSRVALVGAGWIGAEVATAAARTGCEVVVCEAAPTPLAEVFPAEVGERFAAWYAEAGVRLRTEAPVAALTGQGVRLADGEEVAAEDVLLGVGVRPDTDWLASSEVELDSHGAVRADEHLATSVPGVYAVGDCASFPSARFAERLRVEHWDNALSGPVVAAANLLGGEERYDPVPYFWSEQFGRMVQYAGRHAAGDRLVWRGNPAGARWSACWLRGDRLVAVLAVGRPRDLVQGRRRIADATPVDADRLADPDTPVRAS